MCMFVSCAQIRVINGGNISLPGGVSIPGHITGDGASS